MKNNFKNWHNDVIRIVREKDTFITQSSTNNWDLLFGRIVTHYCSIEARKIMKNNFKSWHNNVIRIIREKATFITQSSTNT